MPLIVKGTAIPTDATVTYKGNEVIKIVYKGDEVWAKTTTPVDPYDPIKPFHYQIELYWDSTQSDSRYPFDLDLAMAAVTSSNKCPDENWFVYYGNGSSPSDIMRLDIDNHVGSSELAGEVGVIQGNSLPRSIQKIIVGVFIHDAKQKRQNFGQLPGSYVRIVDKLNGQEMLRYNLDEDFSINIGVLFVDIYKSNGELKLNAIGEGVDYDLSQFALDCDVTIRGK